MPETKQTPCFYGTYSDKISWRCENDTLIISGEGPMESEKDTESTVVLTQPWRYQYRQAPTIRKVIIEEGITSVGVGAFSEQQSLETVVLADSVSAIHASAFYGCTALKTVTLPPHIREIGQGAFGKCSALVSVTIPETIVDVGANAFEGTPFREGLKEKSGLVCLGAYAYLYCGSEPVVNIPDGIKKIGFTLFEGHKQLLAVNIPGSVETIETRAFHDCTALQSITIPETVEALGYKAFANCRALEKVQINPDATKFDKSAFEGTPWLENRQDSIVIDQNLVAPPCQAERFVVPQNVKTIPFGAISKNPLRELEIPGSVERLAEFCCSSLTQLKVLRLPESLHMFPPHSCPIISCPAVETVYYGNGKSVSVCGIKSMGRAGKNAVWIQQSTGIVAIIGSGTVDLDMVISAREEDYADIGSYLVFEYVWHDADVEIHDGVTLSQPLPKTLPPESLREKYAHCDIESKTYYFSVRYV